ncbi:uncharacterized protein si:ch211-245h14.1 isoform X1 [Lampris incognitus]|uniref:uncharacterized protein si:ch211-245h14.1 isoform X1 n=1 Tax=Lampris incognitus TaxID=2546036 RepID=UPI0024B5F330|nr:uncharacterized protein si:ch211-245h14.1 isoform X1 [Lampris incognitus]
MSVLLREIGRIYPHAATEFERFGIITDTEIQSLSREDLNELFGGRQNFKMRKAIHELINKQKPIDLQLKELKALIRHESLKDALGENGFLCNYLFIIRDLKNQMDKAQTFFDAHIDLMEEYANKKTSKSVKDGPSGRSIAVMDNTTQTDDRPQETQVHTLAKQDSSISKSSQRHVGSVPGASSATKLREVKFQSVVSGETFGSHQTILDRVRNKGGLKLVEANGSQDCQIIIVFCPVLSRIMSDVYNAMENIPDDKPVILVLMHHTHNVSCIVPMMSASRKSFKMVLAVNVLYHETAHGLLNCARNDAAVSEMLRLGHCALEHGLALVGKHPDGKWTCGEAENVNHALMECTNYHTERSLMQADLSEIGVIDHSLKSICATLRNNRNCY